MTVLCAVLSLLACASAAYSWALVRRVAREMPGLPSDAPAGLKEDCSAILRHQPHWWTMVAGNLACQAVMWALFLAGEIGPGTYWIWVSASLIAFIPPLFALVYKLTLDEAKRVADASFVKEKTEPGIRRSADGKVIFIAADLEGLRQRGCIPPHGRPN